MEQVGACSLGSRGPTWDSRTCRCQPGDAPSELGSCRDVCVDSQDSTGHPLPHPGRHTTSISCVYGQNLRRMPYVHLFPKTLGLWMPGRCSHTQGRVIIADTWSLSARRPCDPAQPHQTDTHGAGGVIILDAEHMSLEQTRR